MVGWKGESQEGGEGRRMTSRRYSRKTAVLTPSPVRTTDLTYIRMYLPHYGMVMYVYPCISTSSLKLLVLLGFHIRVLHNICLMDVILVT
jgi:hypothetical protein